MKVIVFCQSHYHKLLYSQSNLLEMDCKVHESYALVLQLRRLHLSCALDLVEKFNWEGKREK